LRRPALKPALVSDDAPAGHARARSDLGRFLETRDGPEARNPVELIEIVKSAESPGKGTGVSRTRKSDCDDRFGEMLLRPPRDLRAGGAPRFGASEGQRDRRAAAYTDQ